MLSKSRSYLILLIATTCALVAACSRREHTLRIYFAGDLLLDRGVREQINRKGVAALFDGVRPIFRNADAVVANLECPVTNIHAPVNKKYIFRAEPAWLADVKKSGITHLVMANNHTNDQGRAGITETYKNVLSNHIIPVGYGITQDEACKPIIIEKEGIKVALFSSVLVTLENWAYLPDSPGICQATVEDLKDRIAAFKNTNPDCKVVVMLHWGAEFQETPMPEQRRQSEELVDAGADAIIGCHPHVIQPHTTYKGKPIFYSIGNFVFDQEYDAATKGLMVELIFSINKDTFSVQPIVIRNCTPYPAQ